MSKQQKTHLVLHIGQPKTGSSAIQYYLDKHADQMLENQAILYPNLDFEDFKGNVVVNHARFFEKVYKNKDFEQYALTLHKLSSYCEEKKVEKIIISNEGFDWHWWPAMLRQAIEILQSDYTIVLYLRRQDYWIESAWKQWGHKLQGVHSIQDYIARTDMNWETRLRPWLKLFEKEKIIIRPFEHESIGPDVVSDFLQLAGILKQDDQDERTQKQCINPGFSPEVVEILRHSRHLASGLHDQSLFDFFATALSPRFIKSNPFVTYGLLTLRQRLDIIQHYDASNNKIAAMFFGENRQSLFLEPLPDANNSAASFHGLTTENTVPVLVDLIFYQQKLIEKLKNQHSDLSQHLYAKLHYFLKSNNARPVDSKNLPQNPFFEDLQNPITHCIEPIELDPKRKHIGFSPDLGYSFDESEGLKLLTTQNDPHIIISHLKKLSKANQIRFIVTVPADTIFKIYYQKRFDIDFTEKQTSQITLNEGTSAVAMFLPETHLSSQIRIDPGETPGNYTVHKAELVFSEEKKSLRFDKQVQNMFSWLKTEVRSLIINRN